MSQPIRKDRANAPGWWNTYRTMALLVFIGSMGTACTMPRAKPDAPAVATESSAAEEQKAGIPDTPQQPPHIDGALHVGGAGFPNGRSEAPQPFALLDGVSTDPEYGYTRDKPIRVGSGKASSGPANERMYLNALLTQEGKPIRYERRGSCCARMPSGDDGGRMPLDVYVLTVPGRAQPVLLYLDMYAQGVQLAPVGFTMREGQKP